MSAASPKDKPKSDKLSMSLNSPKRRPQRLRNDELPCPPPRYNKQDEDVFIKSELDHVSPIDIEISVEDNEENVFDFKEESEMFKTEVTDLGPENDSESVENNNVCEVYYSPRLSRQVELSGNSQPEVVGSSLSNIEQKVACPVSSWKDASTEMPTLLGRRAVEGSQLCQQEHITESSFQHVHMPFSCGWKRELVYRNTINTCIGQTAHMCDVYYFTPDGRKLRSKVEVSKYLAAKNNPGLDITHFTFKRVQIFHPPEEIIRAAGRIGRMLANDSRPGSRTNQHTQRKKNRIIPKRPLSFASRASLLAVGSQVARKQCTEEPILMLERLDSTKSRISVKADRFTDRQKNLPGQLSKLPIRMFTHLRERSHPDLSTKSINSSDVDQNKKAADANSKSVNVSQNDSDDDGSYLQYALDTPSKLIASIVNSEASKRQHSNMDEQPEQASKVKKTNHSVMQAQKLDVSSVNCVGNRELTNVSLQQIQHNRACSTFPAFTSQTKCNDNCSERETKSAYKLPTFSINEQNNPQIKLFQSFMVPQRIDAPAVPVQSPSLTAISSASNAVNSVSGPPTYTQFPLNHILSPVIFIPGQNATLALPPPPRLSCPRFDTSVALLPVNVTLTAPPPLQLHTTPRACPPPPLHLGGSVLLSTFSADSFISQLPVLQPSPSLLATYTASQDQTQPLTCKEVGSLTRGDKNLARAPTYVDKKLSPVSEAGSSSSLIAPNTASQPFHIRLPAGKDKELITLTRAPTYVDQKLRPVSEAGSGPSLSAPDPAPQPQISPWHVSLSPRGDRDLKLINLATVPTNVAKKLSKVVGSDSISASSKLPQSDSDTIIISDGENTDSCTEEVPRAQASKNTIQAVQNLINKKILKHGMKNVSSSLLVITRQNVSKSLLNASQKTGGGQHDNSGKCLMLDFQEEMSMLNNQPKTANENVSISTEKRLCTLGVEKWESSPSTSESGCIPTASEKISTPLTLFSLQDKKSFKEHHIRHGFFGSFRMLQTNFTVMMNIFGNLSVPDLLRASCVCRMWHTLAMQNSLWSCVRLDGVKIRNWETAARFFCKVGVKSLNLHGMSIEDEEETEVWKQVQQTVPTVTQLEELYFDTVPASVVTAITEMMPNLTGVGAQAITVLTTD